MLLNLGSCETGLHGEWFSCVRFTRGLSSLMELVGSACQQVCVLCHACLSILIERTDCWSKLSSHYWAGYDTHKQTFRSVDSSTFISSRPRGLRGCHRFKHATSISWFTARVSDGSSSIILMQDRHIPIEPVGWLSGQLVFLPLRSPEPTGSILLNAKFFAAMRGPSDPRTTQIKMKVEAFSFPSSIYGG